ncbi:helix-turn-helix transcriptional regulator [Streptococcus thermophilus]|uniref:helix-turn-helix domain-containing protein n=1 Tax=Streptococcus thermophilus TaxID=1308 RepID=UPI0019D10104|nr:helix-turn-helix transcriptional regulator [Streptococcus thermophilus]MBN6047054.1 helix-turn-helix transcriptional regulator [Streptococcus thermophilus]
MFQTFERIKELANKQGLSINALEEKLGYSRNTLYSLKRQKASMERMQEIADYLNVSLDYLLGRTDNPSIVGRKSEPDDIDEILENAMMFDGKPLTEDDKRAIRGIIAGYMNSKEK